MRFTLSASLALMLTVAASSMNAGQSTPGQPQVTFTKDVAPIFQDNCQACHRPGSIAPMSLLTYQDVRPWARSIRQRVTNREMPPWYIDKNVGITKFKDDPSLTDEEIAIITKWVDSGAPMGNPADVPPPREFSGYDQWHIGKPDYIVTMAKPYILPANGPDNIVDVLVDPGFKEDMYVMAVETKPEAQAFRVAHHITTNLISKTIIKELAAKHGMSNLRVFGSVARGEDGPADQLLSFAGAPVEGGDTLAHVGANPGISINFMREAGAERQAVSLNQQTLVGAMAEP